MVRLTRKINGKYETDPHISPDSFFDKLGQLEDIEETIEIDLLTVFKAVKNGFYDIEGNFYEPYDFSIDLESKCLRETFCDYMKSKSFGFCEYGKTWFLTKEETK